MVRLIKSDLEDKGFDYEETKDMIYRVVFSEPSDEKHPNRYFIKENMEINKEYEGLNR